MSLGNQIPIIVRLRSAVSLDGIEFCVDNIEKQDEILNLKISHICVASLQKGPHVAIYQSRENRS